MPINLPDLNKYLATFQAEGVAYPLCQVPIAIDGLLNALPAPAGQQKGWPWTEQIAPEAYSDKTTWPKLTIVTPSYNQAAFLEQTIRSVLLQNYPNLEYIVIDGGSTDGSLDIIKKYEPWLSYQQSKADRGQSNAINLGFSLASGNYHSWINSDDYYLKGTFIKTITRFEQTGTDFIYGYCLEYDVVTAKSKLMQVLPLKDYFLRLPSLAQPACFWRATIHQPIWEELHCSLDYELWLRMVKGRKSSLIKQPLAVASVHAGAKTHNPSMKGKWQHDHELICANDAHGSVPDWNRRVMLNRIRAKVYKWFNLY